MATNTQNITSTSTVTDSEFQAMCSFISAVLESGGNAKTVDSGQIDVGTVTWPGANHTPGGYEIREFTDSLQGSTPVVYKLEYGRGASAGVFCLWLTIGTGSDGSGNITGEKMARTQITPLNATNTWEWNISAGDSWFILDSQVSSAVQVGVVSIERTKDPVTKENTNKGVLFARATGAAALGTMVVGFNVASTAMETALFPLPTGQTTAVHSSGDVLIYPLIFFGVGEVFIGANLVGLFNNDVTLGNSYTFNVLGQDQTMKVSRQTNNTAATGRNVASRWAYRFE